MGDGVDSQQSPWIAIWFPALLVEGIPQAPMNAEFHSAAVRSVNAFVIHNNKEKSNG